MTIIIKLIGFGSSVIQRLVKTSVKKNLYWEVKDKVVEEVYNGVRVSKQPRKVKVYGLDSTKNVRARLIEILMERVQYHKDKFVAPVLHNEMKSMQIKKNGKVEHSDKTHDDQVFSYLMALYVWYDGQNLVENFGLRKSTIKTDANEELEELDIEDAIEKKERVDFNSSTFEHNEEISKELDWIEKDIATYKTANDVEYNQFISKINARNTAIANNKNIANQFESDTGVNMVNLGYAENQTMTTLPDNLFLDEDFIDDPNSKKQSYLQGNLADLYDKV